MGSVAERASVVLADEGMWREISLSTTGVKCGGVEEDAVFSAKQVSMSWKTTRWEVLRRRLRLHALASMR